MTKQEAVLPDRSSMTLQEEIEYVINLHSRENESNTPDYLLAEFLMLCLAAYEKVVSDRDAWYGRTPPFSQLPPL